MLPKNNRLTRQQFWQVSKTGKSISEKNLVLKFLSNGLDCLRFGIVTSSKLAKLATSRNKLRRLIYQAISTEPSKKGYDVIIFPKSSMLNLDGAQISVEINQSLSKLSSLA